MALDEKYDVIVITRGGGSFEDLFGFSQPDLVETVHNLDQPVLSAIGHQVDTSLLDLVADCCCPTPSLAAQYIIDVNKKFIRKIEEMRDEIKEELLDLYNNQTRELNRCNERLNRIIISYDRVQQSYHNELLQQLNNYAFKLKELDLKLSSMMEKKDNTIIIKSDDKIIFFEDFEKILEDNEDFTINWNGKNFRISDYIYN